MDHLPVIVQIALGVMGILNAILLFAFGHLLSRIKDTEQHADRGDAGVMTSVQSMFKQFEETIREQRKRIDDAREQMLTKDVFREDVALIFERMEKQSHAAQASRDVMLDRMGQMQIAAARAEAEAAGVHRQLMNFVETQAELTTAVTELKAEVKKHYPVVAFPPHMVAPPS